MLSTTPIYCNDEDFSTPEKTIATFNKGCITGDKNLAQKALIDELKLEDTGFNPPIVKSSKIIEKREVDPATMHGKAGDVVIITEDELTTGQLMRTQFLLRKFGNNWKIVEYYGELVNEIEPSIWDDPDLPREFTFKYDNTTYILYPNGKGKVKKGSKDIHKFSIPLDKGVRIYRLQHLKYGDDLILIYEYKDYESVGGSVTRLDGNKIETKWTLLTWTVNMGEPLLHDKYLYITGIGFVGKIDLDTGKFIWKHTDLYRDPWYYNMFDKPRIEGDKVFFTEYLSTSMKKMATREPLTLVVDIESGKIISGQPPDK